MSLSCCWLVDVPVGVPVCVPVCVPVAVPVNVPVDVPVGVPVDVPVVPLCLDGLLFCLHPWVQLLLTYFR